ncbi:MAG: alpha-L-rhamnosidase N-terminal domain-containing protein, partial [Acidimicrobiia bacterium]|nr:alpha-L-rhamnosidase N-terminal domain-containing protein [Acidimicrobiia bacterium]
MSAPTHLRVEHLEHPLGITTRRPRLSWWLPAGTRSQIAYQVEIDGLTAERQESSASVLVPWPGEPLGSRQAVPWRVKVWTDAGESDWSELSTVETGLLEPSDWSAHWIEPAEEERRPDGERPAFVLRTEIEVDGLFPARLYATAHGIYEAFLNGVRVGDIELAPGFTAYDKNLHVQTYDVTNLLRAGANRWEVVLSDGWFRGRTGFTQSADCYGDRVAFLGQLHVGDQVFATGDAWRSAIGPIAAADLMAGQSVDLRVVPDDWRAVRVVDHDLGALTSSPAPPSRRIQELRPVAVTRVAPDRQVVDLGQNISGWVRLSDLGPEGTTTTLTH